MIQFHNLLDKEADVYIVDYSVIVHVCGGDCFFEPEAILKTLTRSAIMKYLDYVKYPSPSMFSDLRGKPPILMISPLMFTHLILMLNPLETSIEFWNGP